MEQSINSYKLSRAWFDFCFENPDLINPSHTAIFFFAIEHCNRLGWKQKFGFPTQMAMDAVGIKRHQTFIKYLNDLVEWGFIKMVEKSKNQWSANVIMIGSAMPKSAKALDRAMIKHVAKQEISNSQSTSQSIGSIDKQVTNNNITINQEFESFWGIYKKSRSKHKCLKKWSSLTNFEKSKIFQTLPDYIRSTPDVKFRKDPLTYLNGKCWDDEVIITETKNGFGNGRNQDGLVL